MYCHTASPTHQEEDHHLCRLHPRCSSNCYSPSTGVSSSSHHGQKMSSNDKAKTLTGEMGWCLLRLLLFRLLPFHLLQFHLLNIFTSIFSSKSYTMRPSSSLCSHKLAFHIHFSLITDWWSTFTSFILYCVLRDVRPLNFDFGIWTSCDVSGCSLKEYTPKTLSLIKKCWYLYIIWCQCNTPTSTKACKSLVNQNLVFPRAWPRELDAPQALETVVDKVTTPW